MDKVKEFMLINNQKFNTFEDKELRIKLINEEIEELKEAINNSDKIEIVDALCDILYVVYGTSLSFGYENSITSKSINLNDTNDLNDLNDTNDTNDPNDPNSIYTEFENFKCTLSAVSLEKLTLYVYKFAHINNINIDEAFKRVHESNMTKFCLNEEEAIETCKYYTLNNTRYGKVDYYKYNDIYIVFHVSDKKILKSINYKKVNLEGTF